MSIRKPSRFIGRFPDYDKDIKIGNHFVSSRLLSPVICIQQLDRALRSVKGTSPSYCRPEWVNGYLGWCASRSINNNEVNHYIGLYLDDVEELRKSTFLEF